MYFARLYIDVKMRYQHADICFFFMEVWFTVLLKFKNTEDNKKSYFTSKLRAWAIRDKCKIILLSS